MAIVVVINQNGEILWSVQTSVGWKNPIYVQLYEFLTDCQDWYSTCSFRFFDTILGITRPTVIILYSKFVEFL